MVFTKSCIVLVLIAVAYANPSQEKRSYQLSDDVEVVSNGFQPEKDARGEHDIEDTVKEYIQSHDVTFKLPLDAAATVSARDLDSGVMNFKLKFSSSDVDEGRGKKHKIKKILIPLAFVGIMLAMSGIPLIVGLIGIKTMNSLQMSFFSFIVSFGTAIYQLFKKFGPDHSTPIITHSAAHDHHNYNHDHHDHHWNHRSLDGAAQQMAYNAYY